MLFFDKFVFVRDNLPLEMHMANNGQSTGLWTRSEHPGNDPKPCADSRSWVKFASWKKSSNNSSISCVNIPGSFLRFTLDRVVTSGSDLLGLTSFGGYDLMIARHLHVHLPAAFAFRRFVAHTAGQKTGGISAVLLSADLSASVLPGKSLPAL